MIREILMRIFFLIMQMPKLNCSDKGLNYTLILENEQGNLIAEVHTFPSFDSGVIKESIALDLKESLEYSLRLQVTSQSQTITSQKYIFSKLLYTHFYSM